MKRSPTSAASLCVLILACQGRVGEAPAPGLPPDSSSPPPPQPSPPPPPPAPTDPSALGRPAALGATGLRRLTRGELQDNLHHIYGVDPGDLVANLPDSGSSHSPFDNDYTAQGVSLNLIQALASFAEAYALRVGAGPTPIYDRAGCVPAGPGDGACFRAIIETLGHLALRRPLSVDELDNFASLLAFAEEEGRFEVAVELLVELLVQHPEHLYRIETGVVSATDPSLLQLEPYAVATRLAFLVTGRGPDEALLAAASEGALVDPAVRRAHAERLWATPGARRQWAKFHGAWLGYGNLSLPPQLAAPLSEETQRLIERVIFEDDAPWLSLFTAEESWLSPDLAVHYGLTAPNEPAWVPYPPERGGGVLSHGAFLAQGSKFGDTSPTLRGARMWERIFCGTLGTPPPDVDTDNPPPGAVDACKTERYFMRNDGRCAGCHVKTDNLGFGLENLGPTGEWRSAEPGRAHCTIEGRGRVLQREFQGPRALGELLANTYEVQSCAATQLFRFATGRPETTEDQATLRALHAQLTLTPNLRALVLALAASPAIAHRPR
ncbi:MAG: DUF1592 domain-containing protein [Deltaproteobacteria bacterium]|nr:DUF1592 domain-containing protein [Deltaproteobacteria bacterium]